MRNRVAAVLGAAALAATAFAGAVAAQQKVMIKEVSAAGDLSERDDAMNLAVKIRVTPPGSAEQVVDISQREHEKYTDKVIGADAKGRNHLVRTYSISRSIESSPTGNNEKVASLQGKSITIKRVNGKTTVSVANGALDPGDQQKMEKLLDASRGRFFPNREVAIGEEWTVDPEMAKKEFEGADNVSAKGKVTELVDYMGHKCAKIAVTFDVNGKFGGAPFPMRMQLSGNGWYAVDIQRTVDLKLEGPITGKGELDQGGTKIPIEANGTMSMRSTEVWQKVGK